MKHISCVFAVLIIMIAYTPSVNASTPPSFPSCTNPTGTLKVQYNSGVHGIVGRTEEYRGRDTVYTLDDTTLLQCFCAEDNSTGIQSNWWKVTGFYENDIQYYKNQGWYYVPNGTLWGLSQDPYLVYNINYSCGNRGSGGGIVSSFTSSNGGGNSSNNGISNILGLPATGGEALYASIALLILSLFYYFRFGRRS